MLDLVRGSRSRETKMLLPAFGLIGEVGIDVGAVKHVTGPIGIENAVGGYAQSRECPNGAAFVIPNQTSLSERHPADPTAPALEIVEHCGRFMRHLLTQALADDRHVD